LDVLAVTPYYPPEGGGLERYAHEILRRLGRTHAVEVIASTRRSPGEDRHEGVPVTRRKPGLVLGNAPIDPGLASAIADRIHGRQPDVVLAHTPVPFPAEAAAWASWRTDTPFVVTYHAGRLSGSSPLLAAAAGLHRHTVERLMLAHADELVAVSPTVKQDALAGHEAKTTIVPPGVDRDRFQSADEADEPRIVFVGPLSSTYTWKGLDTLWTAYERVREQVPEAQLTLIGDGDRRQAFQQRARGLDGHVDVPGRVSDDRLVAELREARVLALPSTSPAESFGMVLAEANACGTPVVASRVGGIPSFVDHEANGLLVDPGDAGALAQALTRLIEDLEEARRLGERGRRKVEAEHDWDRLAARTEQVLGWATGA
jgi:glycosyltransferase involved in cell wall biosynthesis